MRMKRVWKSFRSAPLRPLLLSINEKIIIGIAGQRERERRIWASRTRLTRLMRLIFKFANQISRSWTLFLLWKLHSSFNAAEIPLSLWSGRFFSRWTFYDEMLNRPVWIILWGGVFEPRNFAPKHNLWRHSHRIKGHTNEKFLNYSSPSHRKASRYLKTRWKRIIFGNLVYSAPSPRMNK